MDKGESLLLSKNRVNQTVPLSQGKVAQVNRTRQRQTVVTRQSLSVFIAADTNFQNVWVSERFHQAERERLLVTAKRQQPNQDTQA